MFFKKNTVINIPTLTIINDEECVSVFRLDNISGYTLTAKQKDLCIGLFIKDGVVENIRFKKKEKLIHEWIKLMKYLANPNKEEYTQNWQVTPREVEEFCKRLIDKRS